MRIGVIITVYNLERFVAEAIESVFRQSRKPDKVVVVNDRSTDNSLREIKRFHAVTVINNESNQGVLPSTIYAMQLMDTDIVAFLDGDDRWYEEKIESIHEVFDGAPDVMMMTHSYQWIDSKGKVSQIRDATQSNLERIQRRAAGDPLLMDELLKESILSYKGVWLGSAFAIRRDALNLSDFANWSASLEGHHLSHQDQPLAAFMIKNNPSKRIVYLDKVLFDYRVFGENSSGDTRNAEKALRTLERSRATIARTYDIVRSIKGRSRELAIQANKLLELDYLRLLYSGNRSKAMIKFLKLARTHWSARDLLKETKRLVVVLVLGRRHFFSLKRKLSPH